MAVQFFPGFTYGERRQREAKLTHCDNQMSHYNRNIHEMGSHGTVQIFPGFTYGEKEAERCPTNTLQQPNVTI